MSSEAFTEEWAQRWCQTLNSSPAYRKAAENWEGSVALVMTRNSSSQSDTKAVFLDLWHGECRSARVASQADVDSATYVLSGAAVNWRDVLTGRTPPLMAVMGGKVRLTRGSMAALMPFASAARELVMTVTSIESTFPLGWV
jgi:putative sterol carrier protein